MPLSLCEHFFHKSCLISYLKSRIEELWMPLVCPDIACKTEIGDLDLKDLLSAVDYTKYSNFALDAVIDVQKDFSWCPTPDCKFAFVYVVSENNGREDERKEEGHGGHELDCPVCKKHYCLRCKVPFHDGMTCEEYQVTHDVDKLDAAFYEFAQGQKFKQCPHCAYWVERAEGCDHMRCRCGNAFCYKCGGIYGACEC